MSAFSKLSTKALRPLPPMARASMIPMKSLALRVTSSIPVRALLAVRSGCLFLLFRFKRKNFFRIFQRFM